MSTEYFIELLQLPVNEAFTAKPELFKELVEGAKGAGITRSAYGLTVEDKSKLYWAIHFESGKTPQTVFKTPEEKAEFFASVKAIAAGPPKSFFAKLTEPFPKTVTDAPLTEIVAVPLKPDADKEETTKIADAFLTEYIAHVEGAHGAFWAFATESDPDWTLEKANHVLVFVGWDSEEAHKKVSETEEFKKQFAPMVTVVASAPVLAHIEAIVV